MGFAGLEARPATGPVSLLIGTRKGAFILRGDKTRRDWKLTGPIFRPHSLKRPQVKRDCLDEIHIICAQSGG